MQLVSEQGSNSSGSGTKLVHLLSHDAVPSSFTPTPPIGHWRLFNIFTFVDLTVMIICVWRNFCISDYAFRIDAQGKKKNRCLGWSWWLPGTMCTECTLSSGGGVAFSFVSLRWTASRNQVATCSSGTSALSSGMLLEDCAVSSSTPPPSVASPVDRHMCPCIAVTCQYTLAKLKWLRPETIRVDHPISSLQGRHFIWSRTSCNN